MKEIGMVLCTRGDESGYYVRDEKELNPELVD